MSLQATCHYRIELFGSLRLIHRERVTTRFKLQKAALLLAYLALNSHRSHSREHLVDLLWPELDSKAGRDNLSTTLASLRRDIEPSGLPDLPAGSLLIADRQTIGLASERIVTDVADFDSLLTQARSAATMGERVRLLEQGIELYRGDLLAGRYEDWALTAQAVYRERYQEALLDWAQDLEAQQEWKTAQAAAQRAVTSCPLREEAVLALMRAQARQGQVAGAIETFRQFQKRLRDEMEAKPAQELRQLAERLQRDPEALLAPLPASLLRPTPPANFAVGVERADNTTAALEPPVPPASLSSPFSPSHNLPQWLTPLIGRQQEVQEVRRLLEQTRLLTLTGIGGCGKTRLAIQVGHEVLAQYPDGVWLVELAALTDPALVVNAAAQALSVSERTGETLLQTLITGLASRRILLILDNCEHLIGASAELASRLLRACPNLSLLATSREALTIAGEQPYRVPSLTMPDAQQTVELETLPRYGAIQLFIERARLVKGNFVLTKQNAAPLIQVCRRLDGIPLALELAAARVRSLSLEDINTRLDDRFSLLTGGDRTALPRQQTLRALIDWSYDLLTPQERQLFLRLSVFAGGWTLAAAERVGGGDGTGGVHIAAGEIFDILTALVDKSLVSADVQNDITRYRMLETVRQYAAVNLSNREEERHLKAGHRDYFLLFAEEANPHLAGPTPQEWLKRLEIEHDNLRSALAWCAEDEDEAEGGLRLCGALERFWYTRGYLSEGRERLATALAHPGAQERAKERGDALHEAGVLAWTQGDYASARLLNEDALAIYRELGHKQGVAGCLNNLGLVAVEQGDYTLARLLQEESLAIKRETGDREGIASSLINLGLVASDQGDYPAAYSFYEEGLIIYREAGNSQRSALCLNNLANVACLQGNYASAHALCAEGLAIRRDLGDKRGVAYSLNVLGNVAFRQSNCVSARLLYEESLGLFREMGNRSGIAYALHNLGLVAVEQGDYAVARALYQESLAEFRQLADKMGLAQSLEGFVSLALEEQRFWRAVCLWGAVTALRETIGSPRPPEEREKYEAQRAQACAALGVADDASAWDTGRAMTWEQAADYALQENGEQENRK